MQAFAKMKLFCVTDDNAFKVRGYRSLMVSYRQLPDIDKMLEATDFIFEHSESAPEESLIARFENDAWEFCDQLPARRNV